MTEDWNNLSLAPVTSILPLLRARSQAYFGCVRAAALQAREAAVAAREVAVGGMDCEVVAAMLEAMPNGHSAGADASALVRRTPFEAHMQRIYLFVIRTVLRRCGASSCRDKCVLKRLHALERHAGKCWLVDSVACSPHD